MQIRQKFLAEKPSISLPDGIKLIEGNFVEKSLDIADNSVDLIVTDPPYDVRSLPLYQGLAKVASRVLKDGGSLVTYCGQDYKYQIQQFMESSGLTPRWELAVILSGPYARIFKKQRPRFAYEIPRIDLKNVKCSQGCSSFAHEPHEEVVSALRIELQDTETYNDLERLQIVLLGDCTKNVSIGEQVIVMGTIQKVRVKDKLLTYVFVGLDPINSNVIEYVNKKEPIGLTVADEKEIHEFVIKNCGAVIDALMQLVAPSIIGYEHVKKGLLMCAVNSGKDSVERRLRINALLVGETGLDKTGFLLHSPRLVGLNSKFTSAVNSTVRSLIGVVDKEIDSSGILRLGPIPSANGAICAIDDIGRMSYEDQGFLLTALQHGTIYFGRHGLNTTLEASATFILSANPTGSSGKWKDKEKIDFSEIPLLGPL